MGGCCFPNCANCSEKGFKMMRFPRSVEIRKKWITACKIVKPVTDNSRLCEGHFSAGLFEVYNNSYKLKRNVIPDCLISSPNYVYGVVNKRRNSEVLDLITSEFSSYETDQDVLQESSHTPSSFNTSKSHRELLLEQQINQLLLENTSLKKQVVFFNGSS